MFAESETGFRVPNRPEVIQQIVLGRPLPTALDDQESAIEIF